MCHERWRRRQSGMESGEQHAKAAAATAEEAKTTRHNESRKVRKPLMEKRRRARINDCLDELKRLLLDAELKHPSSRPAKLEKADILELTVRHVRRLTRQERQGDTSKFRAGYSECAREVRSELGKIEPGHEKLGERLHAHLDLCLAALRMPDLTCKSNLHDEAMEVSSTEEVTSSSSGSCSPPPSPPTSALQPPPAAVQASLTAVSSSHSLITAVQRGARGFTLVPTKLPNGDLAFVIPSALRAGDKEVSPVPQTTEEAVWRPW